MTDTADKTAKQLLDRITHLERVLSHYRVSQWEHLRDGDVVIINNTDSLHDQVKGIFAGHEWIEAGYVRLAVKFEDGKTCYYLPHQVIRIDESEPTPAPTPTPAAVPAAPAPAPAPAPEPEHEDEQKQNLEVIESKLKQLKKMPKSTRLSVLTKSLDESLLPLAQQLARERDLID